MSLVERRASYQFGSIQLEHRKRGPAVWVYRYLTSEKGSKRRPKVVLGTRDDLPTMRDAQAASERFRMQANLANNDCHSYMVRGLVDRYVSEILRPCFSVPLGDEQDECARMSYQTAKSYQVMLRRYVLTRWESYSLQDFLLPAVRASVEEWFRDLIRSRQNPKGLAPKTVRSIFNVMRLIFKFAVKWGYLEYNPLAEKRVELPRGSTRREKKAPQLTPSQFFALLTLLEPREKLAVAFAGWLGPRISEAFGLKWGDIDFARSVVRFERGYVQGRITPLKTEASRTNLPVPSEVMELLKSWRAGTPYNHEDDWVFASPYTRGQRPYWPAQLLKMRIQPVAVRAGYSPISWHSFRHTVSAWGKEAGLELEEVKTLLRHENIATTSQIYGEVELEAKRRMQQRLIHFVKSEAASEMKVTSGSLIMAQNSQNKLPA